MARFLAAMVALGALFGAGPAVAQESQVVEVWTCTLKEGKTIEQVQETNGKWLEAVKAKLQQEGVSSYVLSNIVGSPNTFGFIDVYPSLEAWAAAKRAGESDELDEIDAAFEELSVCTTNSLHRAIPS